MPRYNRANYNGTKGDGISYPEKVGRVLFPLVDNNCKYQYSPKWANGKKYDFYLPKYNMIIELHGSQHYKARGFMEDQVENDTYKRDLAKDNGITTYYEINNANELAWFRNSVNNGNNKINAILTNDICLNSKTFEQIGTNPNFFGIFDGQNRTIRDYYFYEDVNTKKDNETYAGIFYNNYGTIRNTNATVNISSNVRYKPSTGNHNIEGHIGGLVADNSGRIQTSSVSGTINAKVRLETNCTIAKPEADYYIGGIAAKSFGTITASFNKAKVYAKAELYRNACNYKRSADFYMGGIVGFNEANVTESYNTNEVQSYVESNYKNTEYYGKIGGLVGESVNSDITTGKILNSYTYGSIIQNYDNSSDDVVMEGVLGCAVAYNEGNINNVYFDNACPHVGYGTPASSSDFKNPSLDVEYFLGNYFMIDRGNINNGYPILKWQ